MRTRVTSFLRIAYPMATCTTVTQKKHHLKATMSASTEETRQKPLVLVTGGSGFIAKHTIDRLLREGYRVRATVRNEEEAQITQRAFSRTLEGTSLLSDQNFCSVFTDLLSDDGWSQAVQGCQYVVHLASPYPLKTSTNREALVPVAREGSLRVVKAALQEQSVERIILVSSAMAMLYWKDFPKPVRVITEDCWTDPSVEEVTAYPLSKTVAERAVWDYMEEVGAKDKLVVVNPMMVWGPMYDDVVSTSSEICRLLLTGSYPALPNIVHGIVDVRDVALLLERALVTPNITGRRLIASSASPAMSLYEIGQVLAKAFPQFEKKIPKYVLPDWLCRLVAYFDSALKMSLIDLGSRYQVDGGYT